MVHPVVMTCELAEGVRTRNKPSGLETAKLLHYEVFLDHLRYHIELSDHPELSGMRGMVLPDLNLQVVKFHYLEAWTEQKDHDYYLDGIRVVETGQRWVVRDLYLDILVYEGRKVEVLDTDEYLTAIAEGYLDRPEVEHVNGLAEYGYSLEAYLDTRGFDLSWLDDG